MSRRVHFLWPTGMMPFVKTRQDMINDFDLPNTPHVMPMFITVTQKVLPLSFATKETGSVTKLPYCFLGLTELTFVHFINFCNNDQIPCPNSLKDYTFCTLFCCLFFYCFVVAQFS